MTDFQPTPQTPEQVDEGLRAAFREAKKNGVMDATPYLKQMTFINDIEKTEAEIKVLQKKLELLKEIETHKSQPKTIRDIIGRWWEDTFSIHSNWDAEKCMDDLADQIEFWILRNNKKVLTEEPSKPRSPLDEIVDRMVKKHQAQKLYNRLYDELGYDFETCEDIVDLVEDWLPKEQSATGSQNVDTELLVDGFNHCLEKMKGMLR